MKKDLLVKTIVSGLAGALLWCGISFIICQVKKESFADTFLTSANLIEMAVCSIAAGCAYYTAQKKKLK